MRKIRARGSYLAAMRSMACVLLLAACGGGGGSAGIPDVGSPVGGHDLASQQAHDLGGSDDLATGSSGPMVGLTFSGCSPDFSGQLVALSGSGSMVVASATAPANGEVQLHLTETSGTISLSSMERVQTGDVVNVLAGTTWTNAQISTGGDPISGTITIHSYDESAAQADLTFTAVMLQNVEDYSICQVDGTLVSTGSTY
jgi:hypothetical protein